MNKILLVLLGLALFTSCKNDEKNASNCPTDTKEIEWANFENDYFKICYPSSWNADNSGTFGSDLTLFDHGSAREISFGRNINIMKQEMKLFPENIQTLAAFTDLSRQQIQEYFTDLQILDSRSIKVDDIPAYSIIYTALQGKNRLHFEQMLVHHKQWFFIMTFTTTEKDSDEAKKLGGEILRTLRLK